MIHPNQQLHTNAVEDGRAASNTGPWMTSTNRMKKGISEKPSWAILPNSRQRTKTYKSLEQLCNRPIPKDIHIRSQFNLFLNTKFQEIF